MSAVLTLVLGLQIQGLAFVYASITLSVLSPVLAVAGGVVLVVRR